MTPLKNWLLGDPTHTPLTLGGKQLNKIEEVVDYLATQQLSLLDNSSKLLLQNLLGKEFKQLSPSLQINEQEMGPAIDSLIHEIAPNTTWNLLPGQNFQMAVEEAFINALSQNQVEEAKKLFNLLDKSSRKEILDSENDTGLSSLEQAILISNDATCTYIYTELKAAMGAVTFPAAKEELFREAPQRWVNAASDEAQKSARQEALDNINNCRRENEEDLLLGGLSLTSLPGFLFLDLPNLTCLNLERNKLTSFAIPQGSLTNLTKLYLRENKLTSFAIPQGSLTNLTVLALLKNELTSFTIPQGCLTNLEKLSLSYNQLTSFPIPQGGLTNLRQLFLNNNQLTSFPVPQGCLTNLTLLYLDYNSLKDLPQQLEHCLLLTSFSLPDHLSEAFSQIINNIIATRTKLLDSLFPPSLKERYDRNSSFEDNFCQLLPESDMPQHVIEHLKSLENNQLHLNFLVHKLYKLIEQDRLDVDSPLGQQIIHYKILLSTASKSPWVIYHLHQERLKSQEDLPLPAVGQFFFDYHELKSSAPEKLPQGVNFTHFQQLLTDFKSRFNSLDEKRKTLIIEYLNATLDKQIRTIDDLLNTVKDPWWATHLSTQSMGESTWKLMSALLYIDTLSAEAGQEMPDEKIEQEGPDLLAFIQNKNFLIQENLLSPKERALLKLLGQVRNCTTGKEAGLNNFLRLTPGIKMGGTGKDKISEAIRDYLGDIISSDIFLSKLGFPNEPLHQAKFIRNRLSKEIKFPLEFDLNTGALYQELINMPPQKLFTTLFEEVKLPKLYARLAESLNASVDWQSDEGIEMYTIMKDRVREDLKSCCKWDDEGEFLGITEKGVPHLLKHYGFLKEGL